MRWRVHASACLKCSMYDAFAGSSPASVIMPIFCMRSSCATLWLSLVLVYDALVHLAHAATIEFQSEYQTCLTSPSTCRQLCASLPFP